MRSAKIQCAGMNSAKSVRDEVCENTVQMDKGSKNTVRRDEGCKNAVRREEGCKNTVHRDEDCKKTVRREEGCKNVRNLKRFMVEMQFNTFAAFLGYL